MVLWRSCLTIACSLPLLTGSISAWSLPTSTFQVTASIVAGCVISGTHTGVFGTLNSVMIWPIDPAINPEEKASELWLENRGNSTTMMQIRVFSWQQNNGQEQYQTQQQVIARLCAGNRSARAAGAGSS